MLYLPLRQFHSFSKAKLKTGQERMKREEGQCKSNLGEKKVLNTNHVVVYPQTTLTLYRVFYNHVVVEFKIHLFFLIVSNLNFSLAKKAVNLRTAVRRRYTQPITSKHQVEG